MVAEDFEELLIETCRLRNQVDTMTEWLLFQLIANTWINYFHSHVIRVLQQFAANEYTDFGLRFDQTEAQPFAGSLR